MARLVIASRYRYFVDFCRAFELDLQNSNELVYLDRPDRAYGRVFDGVVFIRDWYENRWSEERYWAPSCRPGFSRSYWECDAMTAAPLTYRGMQRPQEVPPGTPGLMSQGNYHVRGVGYVEREFYNALIGAGFGAAQPIGAATTVENVHAFTIYEEIRRSREQCVRDELIQQFFNAQVEEQKAWHEANLRAKEFLISHLDEQQKATFETNGWFYVKGKSGKTYRVGPGGTNIRRGENQYCVGPEGLPQFDQLLANKLYLEDDDAALIAKANLISGMGEINFPFGFLGNVF